MTVSLPTPEQIRLHRDITEAWLNYCKRVQAALSYDATDNRDSFLAWLIDVGYIK